jgi:hypothetical protein
VAWAFGLGLQPPAGQGPFSFWGGRFAATPRGEPDSFSQTREKAGGRRR